MDQPTFKILSFEKKLAPEVSLNPNEVSRSTQTITLSSKITDKTKGEEVGWVDFKLSTSRKTLTIETINIVKKKQGYGESSYRLLQSMYPDYTLVSSSQMNKKDDPAQEKPNAVYLWEKLVRLGYAEEDGTGGFRMKK